LRQGPCRSCRRDPRARSRAAVEFLHGAALHLSILALRPLGSLQPCRSAEICAIGSAEPVVVGCGQGGKDRKAILSRRPHEMRLSRRQALGLGIGALTARWLRLPAAAAAEEAGVESHGISSFGDLKYPADFQRFDYVNPDAPKGGLFSTIPSVRAYNQ